MIGSFVRARLAALCLVAGLATTGCATLPSLDGQQQPSSAYTDTGDTRLGQAIDAGAARHPGTSGVYALNRPLDAFAARVLLARAAERSLDVQYYIWHGDITGFLMFEEMWKAAERGVRVRLLIDDNGISGLDPTLAALDSHANIEVRLFNPFANRSMRMLGYATDFSRLNHRMHNKSFTADGRATIVGGRNIGDEYFGAGQHISFADLDVIAVGPAATEVGAAFDLYWNSPSAYPATSIIATAGTAAVPAMQAKFGEVRASTDATTYLTAVDGTKIIQELRTDTLQLDWVPVSLVYDEPTKILEKAGKSDLLLTRLLETLGRTEREIDIISPYFVPGAKGTEALCTLPERKVRLRILTNSLAATDVGAVHAAYGKRRKALLECGASLYELKPDAEAGGADGQSAKQQKMIGGSSTASLHAKSFALDRNRVFVGSFNLDPRSTSLNTEMGLVIESPTLANAISNLLDAKIQDAAYQVVLDADGHDLEWVERTATGEVRHTHEPNTGVLDRAGVKFLSWLPIDWLM